MNNILIFNHKAKNCGVYQYGLRVANILKNSTKYNFIHCEIENENEFLDLVNFYKPKGIIYNFYGGTSPWLKSDLVIRFPQITHYCFHHEGNLPEHLKLDYYIIIDSIFNDNNKCFSIPRPLYENINVVYPEITTPIISSFGFPSFHKGFKKITKIVNEQFDEAIIKLHIPVAFFRDRTRNILDEILPECYNEIKKSGIKLIISNDFLKDNEILQFLASSSLNIFLYDDMLGCGLSSVIDFALSVNVPIAIRKSDMFRHIYNTTPYICIENRSLSEIISSGTEPLQQYRDKWSNNNLIKKCEFILDSTIDKH